MTGIRADLPAGRLPGRGPGGPVISALVAVWRAAIVQKVRSGRLRSAGWPYGLGAVVAVTAVLYVAAGVLALLSAPLRRADGLAVPGSLSVSVPVHLVWLLTFLMVFALALFHTAAIHATWWLTGLGLLVTSLLLGVWGVMTAVGGGMPLGAVATTVLVAVLVTLSLVRRRRRFAWWEFPMVLAVIGTSMALSLVMLSRQAAESHLRLTVVFLDQTVSTLQTLVAPAAIAAGAAVAEITVALTLAATRQLQRASRSTHRRWPQLLLAAVVVVRLVQIGRQLWTRDQVAGGWLVLVGAALLVAGLAGVSLLLIALGRGRAGKVQTEELPQELTRMGIPIGVAMIVLLLPLTLFLLAFQVLWSLDPTGLSAQLAFDPSLLTDQLSELAQLSAGVIMVGLAVRETARRGRLDRGLLLGCAGVVLIMLEARVLTGYRWALRIDADAVSLVATVLAVAVIGWHLVRHRLTAQRATALTSVLILCALVSSRDFVSDPVGALVGYSGVALVLFGLTWDFLTGSDWANRDGSRFPRPVRVLLLLAYTLLTAAVVAYSALSRSRDRHATLDDYAQLGDLVLGTALLAAAFVTILRTVRTEEPLG